MEGNVVIKQAFVLLGLVLPAHGFAQTIVAQSGDLTTVKNHDCVKIRWPCSLANPNNSCALEAPVGGCEIPNSNFHLSDAGQCTESEPCYLVGGVLSHTPPAAIHAQEPDHPWHLFVQSRTGAISLIKDLNKHECEFARARALGEPATEAEKQAKEDAYKATAARWNDWKVRNECGEGQPYRARSRSDIGIIAGEGISTTGSFKSDNGMCFRGPEFRYPGEEMAPPWIAQSAECFQ